MPRAPVSVDVETVEKLLLRDSIQSTDAASERTMNFEIDDELSRVPRAETVLACIRSIIHGAEGHRVSVRETHETALVGVFLQPR